MRLIDADAAAEKCKEPTIFDLEDVPDFLEECPTIDAEPVRHGQWIPTKERNIWDEFTEVLKCSECGKFASHGRGIVVQHRYCPNCGAKMDGESEVLE